MTTHLEVAPVDRAARFTSCLYECRVSHERFAPKAHRFVYRLFYFAVDLDELPALDRRFALFSFNRANVFSFRETDFFPTTGAPHHPSFRAAHGAAPPASLPGSTPGGALKARVVAWCAARGVALGPRPRVLLVTLPRVLGFQFNPVSFYFCFDSEGAPAGAIAEVTNTYREVKPYFLPLGPGDAGRVSFRLRVPKYFYVSPFSHPELAFDFTLQMPGERLAVRIDDYESNTRLLHTTLVGRRAPLSNHGLAWFLLKYPLITLTIITLIHWQAFRLWIKRVPYFAKADHAGQQRDLYRPHASVTRPAP